MTNPPNDPPAGPPDPSHYPPPQQPAYYPGGTPGVYDPMSAPPTYTPPFTSPPQGGGDNAGMIIGIVIGGVCLIAVLGVVVFLVARPEGPGGAVADPSRGPSSTGYQPPNTGTAAGPSIDPKADIQGDGTYIVGEDLKAGDYATTVPDASSLCYWERLKGTSGEFDDIIANGVADPGEKVTVTIESKDEAFKSQGCGPWMKA